ncbi:hypothetical protein [Thermoactinospora rubra]|uniref:hypothetical protein n=1 Tax=Thermoactinospora rubra TaxID=1088767 RepID=UPI000A10AC8B|nr:hypothetical protein [Thermoactinospora rubra]
MSTFALFAQLKLRLISGNLRGATERKIGFIFSVLAALFLGGLGFLLMSLLRLARPDIATDLGIVAYSAFAVGWAIIPLMSFGLDDTLDPARLALFPLRTRELAVGLFASSATGVWPLATLLALAGSLVGLPRGWSGVLVGIPAVLLAFALCLVLSRLVTTALSGALRSRRGRDALAVAAIGLVLVFQLPNLVVNRGIGDPAALLKDAAAVLRWTPPGMAAHAVAAGGLTALGELAVVAVAVVLVAWLWIKTLNRALVTPEATTRAASVRRSKGVLDRLLPDGPLAAVVFKEVRYIRRDPRFRVGWLVSVVVTGVLAFSMSGQGGGQPAVVIGITCLGAAMIGAQLSNAYGIDGRSLWMNAVVYGSEQDLRRDFAGRHLAASMVAVPLLALLALAAGFFAGDLGASLAGMLTAWGVFGIALGTGAVTSVLIPYTVPDRLNAFTGAAPGQGGTAFLGSMGAMMATGLLALPVVLPVILGLSWLSVLALPYGVAATLVGERIAGKIGRMRMPEILDAVTKPA